MFDEDWWNKAHVEFEDSIDKSLWLNGPWEGEPDRVIWTSPAGFACRIERSDLGTLNGYVGVDSSDIRFGVGYDDIYLAGHSANVHGGLTFAGSLPGSDLWWFGFDIAHAWDRIPAMEGLGLAISDSKYRDPEYVIGEN